MKWTVVWIRQAEAELAVYWLNPVFRAAVSASAREIDRELQSNPQSVGESRPDGERIHFVAPLGVRFEVSEDDRLVRVLRVWQYPTHGVK